MALPSDEKPKLVRYPESDGVPMGESDLHISLLVDLFSGLRAVTDDQPDLYVACDLIVYYKEGDNQASVVPDIFAVRGVGKHPRKSWLTWNEAKAPEFVLEILSDSSYITDQGNKKVLYGELGVREYFMYDPQHRYLKPSLIGYRMVEGEWQRLAGTRLRSEVLGVDFFLDENDDLRMAEAATGAPILSLREEREAREQAEAARMLAEEARMRAEGAARITEEARLQTEEAARREAELAAARIAALEAELARREGRG